MKPEDLKIGSKYMYIGTQNEHHGKVYVYVDYLCFQSEVTGTWYRLNPEFLINFIEYPRLEDATKHTCNLREYIGFTQTYKYCEECGKKEQWNP